MPPKSKKKVKRKVVSNKIEKDKKTSIKKVKKKISVKKSIKKPVNKVLEKDKVFDKSGVSKSKKVETVVIQKPLLDKKELLIELQNMQKRRNSTKNNRKKAFIDGSDVLAKYHGMPEPLKYMSWFAIVFIAVSLLGLLTLTVYYGVNVFAKEKIEKNEVANTSDFSKIVEGTIKENEDIKDTTSSTSTSTTSTTTSSLEAIVCEPPYMRFGMGCCLDKNVNDICDSDEVDEMISTTTTVVEFIRCKKDSDCGPTRIEYRCDANTLVKQTITNFCLDAGTYKSVCEPKAMDEVINKCEPSEQCYIRGDNAYCKKKTAENNLFIR